MEAEHGHAKEEREQDKLNDKVTAVFDAQHGKSRDVKQTQCGGQQGEHGRHPVRPDTAQLPSRFFFRIHIPFTVSIPSAKKKKKIDQEN